MYRSTFWVVGSGRFYIVDAILSSQGIPHLPTYKHDAMHLKACFFVTLQCTAFQASTTKLYCIFKKHHSHLLTIIKAYQDILICVSVRWRLWSCECLTNLYVNLFIYDTYYCLTCWWESGLRMAVGNVMHDKFYK